MSGEDLIGALFVTAKDLRHLAEQEFGELFVPTEVVAQDEHTATYTLQVRGIGRVTVHAERQRDWHPFNITRVELPRESRSWVTRTSRMRSVS